MGDILSHARDIVGEDVLLAATLDPHSHLTQRRFEAADLLVAWKEFPHVDIEERSRELVSLTLRSLRREVRPVMAKHDCRMITSLPTTQPAIREFVDKCMATEHHSEMSSLSTLDVHPGELNAESDSIQSAGSPRTHHPVPCRRGRRGHLVGFDRDGLPLGRCGGCGRTDAGHCGR